MNIALNTKNKITLYKNIEFFKTNLTSSMIKQYNILIALTIRRWVFGCGHQPRLKGSFSTATIGYEWIKETTSSHDHRACGEMLWLGSYVKA